MQSPLLFATVVHIIPKKDRSAVNGLLYADDLVMEDLKERFWNSKNAIKSKGLKVNTRKTKLMVSMSEGELFKRKIDPCEVCGRRVIQCCTQNVEIGFMADAQK